MENKFSNLFDENIDNFRVISACPVCSTKYHSAEITLLEEKDDRHLVYIRCKKCHTSVLALILANSLGISSMGLITDLTSDDAMKFRNQPGVSANDIIDIHQMLKKGTINEDDL